MKTANEIINAYLNLGGNRDAEDFAFLYKDLALVKSTLQRGTKEYIILEYIEKKLKKGLSLSVEYGSIFVVVDEESKEDIEDILKEAGYLKGIHTKAPAKRKAKPREPKTKPKRKGGKRKKSTELGKLVDHGTVAPRGKSDIYWGREGIDLIFRPNDQNIRVGQKIPDTYKYADVRFLEDFYGLRGFEFGNWLSQQDRVNYLSGLGLALFDLHKAIGFSPKQISIKGKLSVAFGARGRGKALAHFEPGSFAINLTRYSRPAPLKSRSKNFRRVNQILSDGGVGAFAHEYGHALDYFGGLHVERGDSFSLSGDDSTRVAPDQALLKKNSLRGCMERLMNKIIWKNTKSYSDYYNRLTKGATRKYFIQRNEIFARSFEVYVQYKLGQHKYKNVFLNHPKYPEKFYLSLAEMKKLEPEYDALMKALKKHL